MERRIAMREVIRRFLRHLDAEKNASPSTIESYRCDLTKFDDYLIRRLGKRFLQGDVFRDHIRDYLMWLSEVGHQKPNGPSARARALAAIRSFSNMLIVAGLLRDNPFDFFSAIYFLIARRLFCLLRRCQFFRASCFML